MKNSALRECLDKATMQVGGDAGLFLGLDCEKLILSYVINP